MTHVLGMLDNSGTFHELIPVPSTIGRDHRAHADASKSKTLKIRWKKVSHSKQEAHQDSEVNVFHFLGSHPHVVISEVPILHCKQIRSSSNFSVL